jgi:hypothetical protein
MDWLLWRLGRDSHRFWNAHYRLGGTSGPGSTGVLADYKAEFINNFIKDHHVASVTDFGCGDGNQLSLLECPVYVGLDVSKYALVRCMQLFCSDSSKSFFLYKPELFMDRKGIFRSELALSLDVIFHLVEDATYGAYMDQLFDCAERYVIIYSSNSSGSLGNPRYTKHRPFVDWVSEHKVDWEQLASPENPLSNMTKSSFYIFARRSKG